MTPIVFSPGRLIFALLCGLSSIVLNFIILRQEIIARRNASIKTKFTTRSLKYYSVLCIITGFLSPVFMTTSFIPIMCMFSGLLWSICAILQTLFMGLYQLSRLKYCFANSQIHSDKGYPKVLFVTMYVIGILAGSSLIVEAILTDHEDPVFYSKCKYDSDFYFYLYPVDIKSVSLNSTIANIWVIVSVIVYLFWDMVILFLFIRKIQMFKNYISTRGQSQKEQKLVEQRVLNILHKICIMTIFYQIIGWIILIIATPFGWIVLNQVTTLAINIAMYLMMDYNGKSYRKFLQLIKRTKFDIICYCCCRYMITQQLDDLSWEQDSAAVDATKQESSPWETRGITIHNHHIDTNGNEGSINTVEMEKQNE